MKIDEADQWLRGGECSRCRRKKYCRKACTANNDRMKAAALGMLAAKCPAAVKVMDMLSSGERSYL